MTALWLALAAQDLFERDRALRRALPPAPDLSTARASRASIAAEIRPDIGCGGFDVKASFRSLFDKNVREEFLGGALKSLEKELAGSALVLACYASPTVCDAIKHYRVSANGMLGMELDACRSLEGAVGDERRRSQARSVKECLDERAARGEPIDRARKECAASAELRGFDGKKTAEIDLLRDLGLGEGLVAPLRMGPGTVRAEARATAVAEAYEARRRTAEEAWRAALADPAKPAPGEVSRLELSRLAAMAPAGREAAVRSVAAAQAFAELTREAHDAERALEAAEIVAAPEVREELGRRRAILRAELGRLGERFEAERRVSAAIGAAAAAAEAEVAERARERLAPRRAGEAKTSALDAVKPWGCETKKGADHATRKR
jgi:hypothetical protein